MQKVSSGLRWSSIFRRLPLSVSLMGLIFIYLLVNCAVIIVSQAAGSVSAAAPALKPAPQYDIVNIPSIGLSSRHVPVGVTATNNIDVHPTLVGMYTKHGQLGQPGTVFLDGHNPGVFNKLPQIAPGASITIAQASGESFRYTVVHTETVQLAGIDMKRVLSPYDGVEEGLNLMTCVGTYSAQTGTTDQRFVAYAVRV